MNTRIRYSLAAMILAASTSWLAAADEKPSSKDERKSLRVLAPGRESRAVGPREREKVEMETVAFLGVETTPVSTTTSVQLGLQRGTGLVVNHIVPKSAADGVLKEHDILLKLDDQILIETRQLSVLIRNHKEGDDVVVSYLRGGQKATATVKLGKTESPKLGGVFGPGVMPFGPAMPGSHFEYFTSAPGADDERADVDRMLSMIRRAPAGEPMRIQIDNNRGPGFRAMALHTANSNMVFTDNEGSLELTAKDGAKSLVAKNANGEQLFSGPVSTPEERKAMPPGVRARLEKLEGMHDLTFRTDGDFRGAEGKVMRPRGISLPMEGASPGRMPHPAFY